MNRYFYDLHIHSCLSPCGDDDVTPANIAAMAALNGLQIVALTDHNTVAGLPDFMETAKEFSVKAVPGVEFSSDYEEKDVHILALFVRPEHYEGITAVLEEATVRKEESNRLLVENLNRAGFALDYEAIIRAAAGTVNRAHIAGEMTRLGYTSSVKDAFARYLAPEHGYYQPPRRMSSFDTIRYIKSLGAVAVMAHPLLTFTEDRLRRFLPEAVEAGLDGMETEYSTYDEETTNLARRIAEEFGLLRSGGSDFHALRKPDIQLGTGRGTVITPLSLLETLEKRAK